MTNSDYYIPCIRNENGQTLMINREEIPTFLNDADLCIAKWRIDKDDIFNIYYVVPFDEKYGICVDLSGRVVVVKIKRTLFGHYKHKIVANDSIVNMLINSNWGYWGNDNHIQVFEEYEEPDFPLPPPTQTQLQNAFTLNFGKVKI